MAEPATTQLARGEDARADLERRLSLAFQAEPLEAGFIHPAEGILQRMILDYEANALVWIAELALDESHPAFAASVLRCVGEVSIPGEAAWKAELIRGALAVADVEMRDAAVQAAEAWGDPELVAVLRAHDEPIRWLRDYIEAVVRDLTE